MNARTNCSALPTSRRCSKLTVDSFRVRMTYGMIRRRSAGLSWILVAVTVSLLGLPAVAAHAETRASLPDIEDEVMCTICGTLLEESQSPQADRERALIRKLIARGEDKDQIKDAIVAEYGPRVLLLRDAK